MDYKDIDVSKYVYDKIQKKFNFIIRMLDEHDSSDVTLDLRDDFSNVCVCYRDIYEVLFTSLYSEIELLSSYGVDTSGLRSKTVELSLKRQVQMKEHSND